MRLQKHKRTRNESRNVEGNRLLISINVIGSAGPLRFVVNEDDLVSGVIDTALKSYARVGRLPVLGTDSNHFVLHYTDSGSDALNPWETIGSTGGRNFMMFKKPSMTEGNSQVISRKGNSWRAWIYKSLTFKTSSL